METKQNIINLDGILEILKNYLREEKALYKFDNCSYLIGEWFEASENYYLNSFYEMSDEEFELLENKILSWNFPPITKIIKNSIHTEDGREMLSEAPNMNTEIDENSEILKTMMLSLEKIKFTMTSDYRYVHQFLFNNLVAPHDIDVFVGFKLDGQAIKIVWNKDFSAIETILTRGGQEVSKYLQNHPDILNTRKHKKHIIHGELVINKKIFFEKWHGEREDKKYKNPRNCINGIMRIEPLDLTFITLTDGINPITDGYVNVIKVWYPYDKNKLEELHNFSKKDEFPFLCDGLVVGYKTSKQVIKNNYPMNMVAVKFKSLSVQTRIVDVNYTQKKSGALTPVYEVEPVLLDGSTVTNANGYNYSMMKSRGIGIGSLVTITKSGDIIPVVDKVLTRSTELVMPKVAYYPNGKHLYALDEEESKSYKFVLGMKVLEIEGIGTVLAEKIGDVLDWDITEIFDKRHKDLLLNTIGGGVNWNKFCQVYEIKNIPLNQLIELLQFNNCGKTLAYKFSLLITKQSIDTKGIDKIVLKNICSGEGFTKIKESIEKLKGFGVSVIKPHYISTETITFEMTGALPNNLTKADFVNLFRQKIPNSMHTTLTRDTKILFVNDLNSTSTKANKARKYGVKLITYLEAMDKDVRLLLEE